MNGPTPIACLLLGIVLAIGGALMVAGVWGAMAPYGFCIAMGR